jgi:tetratricopeptide (TPR) repeat protein
MKNMFLLIVFLISLVGCVHSPEIMKQTPVLLPQVNQLKPDWVSKETESDGKFHYFVGISGKYKLERDARHDAFRDAVKHLAGYIGIYTSIDWESIKVSGQLSSQITDFKVHEQEEIKQIIRACFSRLKAKDWYTERYGDCWKTYVRTKIPADEVERAIMKMEDVWRELAEERQHQQQFHTLLPAFNKIARLTNNTNEGLVTITSDRSSYTPGEIITLRVSLKNDAYLTIFNYDTSGDIKVMLPNYFRKDNFYRQGTHSFRLKAEKPGGIDRLKIFATLKKIEFFDLKRLTATEDIFIIRRGDIFSAEKLANSIIAKIDTLNLNNWGADKCEFRINAPEIILPTTTTIRRKPKLEIKIENLENIFPARCGYYRFNPIGWVKINNNSDIPACRLKVSLMIPDYMKIPYEKEVYVRANSSSKIPLFATFDKEKIFEVNENTHVSAQLKITYENEEVFSETPLLTIFHKNAMDWKKPKSIAGFITPNDESIKEFTAQVIRCLKEVDSFKPKELLHPIAIFEAISALLPKYIPDTRSSRSFPGLVLDSVKYPYETLNLPVGDCDDFTILYATCLASIGKKVALITIPEHVFLAFDTGIHLKNKDMFNLPEGSYLEINDHIWLPMELTKADNSFIDAWQAGAEVYSQFKNSPELKIIDLEDACKIYPAVAINSSGKVLKISQLKKEIILRVDKTTKDIKVNLARIRKELIRKYTSEKNYNQLGYMYAILGEYNQAIEEFTKAKNWNNIGNIYLLQGAYTKAETSYRKAINDNPDNGGIYLNQAICCILQGDEDKAKKYFKQAIELYPDYHQLCFDIGLDWSIEQEDLKAGGIASLILKIKTLLEEVKKRLVEVLTPEKVEEKKLEGHVGIREERGIVWEGMSHEELIRRVCYWQLGLR